MNKDITTKAYKAFHDGMRFKEERMKQASKNVEMYNLKQEDEQIGFLNIPTTDMHGYVEDWAARMPKLNIKFKAIKSLADAESEKKLNALHERDKLPQFADYDGKNRAVNKYACVYGVGIAKVWSESINGYKHHFDVIDPVDFFCQPNGGADLETHKYCGETGIFLTKTQLEEGEKSGIYKGAKAFFNFISGSSNYIDQSRSDYEEKIKKYALFNKEPQASPFDELFHFFEINYEYKGERYYELIDVQTGMSIRQKKLTDLFKSGLYPYVAWQPKRDIHNFWSISPADVKYPSCVLMQEAQNAYINNVRQLVKPARTYRPESFDRPPKYIPNGFIPMRVGSPFNADQAIQRLDVVDLTNPLLKFMDSINFRAGVDTGITAGMQGQSETDKVGINERNIQQANRKIFYSNESHNNFAIEIGKRWLDGVREHLGNKESVKIIGALGLETVKVLKEDAEVEYDIEIEDMEQKTQDDMIKTNKIMTALNNPVIIQQGNPKKVMELILKTGEISDSEIKEIMDVDQYGESQYVEKAENIFQRFIEGDTPDMYRQANQTFCQRLYDLVCNNKDEMKPQTVAKVYAYIDQAILIAEENAVRNAKMDAMKMSIQQLKQAPMPTAGMTDSNPTEIAPEMMQPEAMPIQMPPQIEQQVNV